MGNCYGKPLFRRSRSKKNEASSKDVNTAAPSAPRKAEPSASRAAEPSASRAAEPSAQRAAEPSASRAAEPSVPRGAESSPSSEEPSPSSAESSPSSAESSPSSAEPSPKRATEPPSAKTNNQVAVCPGKGLKIQLNDPLIALTTPTTWPAVSKAAPSWYGARMEPMLAQKYKIQDQLGEGTYGVVWRAVNSKTGGAIAVKQIKDAFQGACEAQLALREAVFLRCFGGHPHITALHDIVLAANGQDLYLVMDVMDIDLYTAIYHRNLLDIHHRVIASQLLQALKFLHSRNIAHRDLKPNNVLMKESGLVKLADFGLARCLAQPEDKSAAKFSSYIINRSYRPPEIELGGGRYTTTIDMWSVGCLLAEMVNRRKLFQATNFLDHMWSIVLALAPLNAQDIAAVENGEYIKHLIIDANRIHHRTTSHPSGLEQLLAGTPAVVADLIKKLLVFDPAIRWSAAAALSHPFVAMVETGNEPNAPREPFNMPLLYGNAHPIAEYRAEVFRIETELNGHQATIGRPLPKLPTPTVQKSGRPLPKLPTIMENTVYGRPLPPIPVGANRKRKRRPRR